MSTDFIWNIDLSQEYADVLSQEVVRQGGRVHHTSSTDIYDFQYPAFYVGTIEGMKNCQRLSRRIDWCDWDTLSCTSYYSHWGKSMLTQKYGFHTLAEIRRQKDELWQRYYDREGYVYFRPNGNDKVFSGGVLKKELVEPWLLQTDKSLLRDDLLCLLGTPLPIYAEYRLVIANGKVVTGSQYMLEDRIRYSSHIPQPVISYAEEAAATWSPHPMFVMDLAITDGYVRIIECGSIHTAGLYEADRAEVVKAVHAATVHH